MCGIAGLLSPRGAADRADVMSKALSHRGPDDSGSADIVGKSDERLGRFVHRRLAVIDLTAGGHQPMFSPDGNLCIVYNGEIFNYAELKAGLEGEGAVFKSTSDTEVLLAGWQRHGLKFLSRLRGMFAFAIWNRANNTAHLVRDAFGIKPLYVAENGGEVVFASELRALLATGIVPRSISGAAVESFLFTGSVAEPLTIIDGVKAIPPGCAVTVALRDNGFSLGRPERFVSAFSPGDDTVTDRVAAASLIRDALRESVRYHLVSDVPVGVFLSGGIDSSAVAALASEVSARPLDTFTVTFSEKDFSEAGIAKETARRLGSVHHEIPISGDNLLAALPEAFSVMDQPSLDGLNTFVVSRAVREHDIKVVLSGLGGDELFGGYPSFRRARQIAPVWKLPASVRSVGARSAGVLNNARADRMGDALLGDSPSVAAYLASRTLFGDRQVAALTGDSNASAGDYLPSLDDVDMSRLSPMQQVSLLEITGYMRNTLLRDSDVFSMAHALELRVPLVDTHVARAAGRVSDAIGTKRAGIKPVLVDAVRDLLSPATIEGPKKGFTLPFETWMRSELFGEVDSVLGGSESNRVGLVPAAVAEVWTQFQRRAPGVNWSRPWALYTLVRWAAHNDLSGEMDHALRSSEAVALSAGG